MKVFTPVESIYRGGGRSAEQQFSHTLKTRKRLKTNAYKHNDQSMDAAKDKLLSNERLLLQMCLGY